MNMDQYKETYNSGIYVRQGTQNLLLEDHTYDQAHEWLQSLPKEGLIRTIHNLILLSQQKDYLVKRLLETNSHITIPPDIQKEIDIHD